MKESLWGYWLIILAIFILSVMLLLQNYTTTNEQDVYLIKEITDAAMGDSLDLAHYRKYGEIRIIKEKFVENFIRRFSETININKNYKISFYDIYEAPPKVSVKVATTTGDITIEGTTDSYAVVNKLDAILEDLKTPNTPENNEFPKYYKGNKVASSTPSKTQKPSESSNDDKKESITLNFSGITQNPKQVFSYNGKDVNMSCACGPLSLTSIIESKGKSNKLYEYLSNSGYTLNKLSGSGSQSQKMAALTFSKMSNSGLNGPTNGNAQRGSTWCGSNGNYTTSSEFSSIVTNSGLSITGKGGGLNRGSTGFADKIYEQLKNGSLVMVALPAGYNKKGTGFESTGGGHYVVIYGYDAKTNTFLFYDGYNGRGNRKESWDVVNSSVVEYIGIS